MRVLFTLIPEKGHINPYIAPAAHLRDRGHTVAFHAIRDISEQLRRAGFDLFLGSAEKEPPADANRGAELARTVRDREALRDWIRALLIDSVPERVEPLRRVVADFRPDAIVTDPMVYEAAIAAHLERVPWAAVSNSLNPVLPPDLESDLLDTVRSLACARDELFAQYDLELTFRGCDMLSPHLTVAFTTPAFVGRDIPGVRMAGPSIPPGRRGDESPFPWERLRSDVPVVYLSLGSQIYYQPRIFRTVIEAVSDREVQLVLSVNELLGSDLLEPLPKNVLPVHYAPQLELLPKVQAMVTHGGANSVMEALHFGAPLLISPICNDQFHQAHFIQTSGVGLTLDLEQATADACWRALDSLLSPGTYRDNAARVAASYRLDGGLATARWIEEMIER